MDRAARLGLGAVAVALVGTAPALAEPAMWIAYGPSGTAILYGTDHEVSQSPAWDTPRLHAAFDGAQELWLETAPSRPRPAARTTRVSLVRQPAVRSFRRQLSSADQRLLKETESRLGIDPRLVDRLRPGIAGLEVLRAAYRQAGLPVGFGVEPVLEDRARARGIPILGLERSNPAVVAELLTPRRDQGLGGLRQIMRDYPRLAARRVASVRAWEAGDVDALARCDDGLGPQLRASLLTKRNAVFANRIAERLSKPGKVFVAVGSCHLTADGSVISLLRDMGIRVERS